MRAKVSQIEPAGARVGVIESHREPERDRERQGETRREPVRARESQIEPAGARVGVTESHREPERETGRDKGRVSKSQRKPQRELGGTRVS